MKLVSVYDHPDAVRTLYDLLHERTPEQSISHREMPSYEAHARFVKSKPYTAWYLLEVGFVVVGAVYLSKRREVGLFIFERHHGRGHGSQAIALLRAAHPGPVYANISPRNVASRKFFDKLGFKHLQDTYVSE